MNLKYTLGIIFTATTLLFADTTLVRTDIEYSIYLPDNWVMSVKSDSQHIFYDTTYQYSAQISLTKHTIDPSDNISTAEWTQGEYLAYTIGCDEGIYFDPWGVILYRDSTTRQGDLWAPEAYAFWFPLDSTVGPWAEYIRYTASGNNGYELYALGDTTDMKANIGTYAGILQSIRLPELASSTMNPRNIKIRNSMNIAPKTSYMYSPLGKRLPADINKNFKLSSGIYFLPNTTKNIRIKY